MVMTRISLEPRKVELADAWCHRQRNINTKKTPLSVV